MPTVCLGCRLPKWPAMRFVALLGLGLLAGVGPTACTSTNPASGPPNTLNLSSDGREIIMTGEMRDGLASKVTQMLETHPHISAIELESRGGRVAEGYQLALLIKQHHLSTFSTEVCASACTIAYMAGEPRFFAKNAKLGFHSLSLNGVKTADGDAFLQLLYQEADVPKAFIDRVLATEPGDLWFPTTEELVKARVVTNIVADQNFVPSSWKSQETEEEVDRSLKSDRLLAAVANLDPGGYQKLLDAFLKSQREGSGHAQAIESSWTALWRDLMPNYFRHAPDDLLVRYQRIRLERVRYIEQNAPAGCVSVTAPTISISAFANRNLPTKLAEEHQQVLIDLVTAATQHPASFDAVQDKKAEGEFNRAILVAGQPYAKKLEVLYQNSMNSVSYCQVAEAYYEALLALPQSTAGRITRAHLSEVQ